MTSDDTFLAPDATEPSEARHAALPPPFPPPELQPPPELPPLAGIDVAGGERVTCPECGATQEVQLNRRDAVDFCRRCDFPLFWAPQRVTRERDAGGEAESLRRLPGTVGRTTLASVPCPHCAEPNTVRAEVCVRCELPMHPIAPPPPPPPVVALPPPPEPAVVEPEPGTPWWVWLIVGLGGAAVVVMVILAILGTFD